MDAELSRVIRATAMRMGNYRFAQGQTRERGENAQADEYADEADKAWRELCRMTEPTSGVAPSTHQPLPGKTHKEHQQ